MRIGSGEAIMNSPFKILVLRKLKRLVTSIYKGNNENLKATMPIPKKMFVAASSTYWQNYGKRNGITREQMAAMEIEPSD